MNDSDKHCHCDVACIVRTSGGLLPIKLSAEVVVVVAQTASYWEALKSQILLFKSCEVGSRKLPVSFLLL